jgi:hypothetical protein
VRHSLMEIGLQTNIRYVHFVKLKLYEYKSELYFAILRLHTMKNKTIYYLYTQCQIPYKLWKVTISTFVSVASVMVQHSGLNYYSMRNEIDCKRIDVDFFVSDRQHPYFYTTTIITNTWNTEFNVHSEM